MRKKYSVNALKKIANTIGGIFSNSGANMAIVFRIMLISISALCIAVLTLLIFIRSMPSTHAPDIVGQTLIDGILSLQERSLTPFIKVEYNSAINQPAGTIVRQRPSAGTYVRTGQKIELIVHSGTENTTMPNLIGTAFDDVENAVLFLDSTGSIQYRIDTVTYDYSDLPIGTIILQTPQAGETVGYFTNIHVVVSLGPETTNNVRIPNLVGIYYETALSQIIASKIPHSITLDTALESDIDNDLTIIIQNPPSGTYSNQQIVEFVLQAPNQLPADQFFGIYTLDLSTYELGSNIEVVQLVQTLDTDGESDNQNENTSEQLLLQFALFQNTVYLPYVLPIGSMLEIRVDGQLADSLEIGS